MHMSEVLRFKQIYRIPKVRCYLKSWIVKRGREDLFFSNFVTFNVVSHDVRRRLGVGADANVLNLLLIIHYHLSWQGGAEEGRGFVAKGYTGGLRKKKLKFQNYFLFKRATGLANNKEKLNGP